MEKWNLMFAKYGRAEVMAYPIAWMTGLTESEAVDRLEAQHDVVSGVWIDHEHFCIFANGAVVIWWIEKWET